MFELPAVEGYGIDSILNSLIKRYPIKQISLRSKQYNQKVLALPNSILDYYKLNKINSNLTMRLLYDPATKFANKKRGDKIKVFYSDEHKLIAFEDDNKE
jgi:hypothetical protein